MKEVAGHMRLAGRVFETAALVHSVFKQTLYRVRFFNWKRSKNIFKGKKIESKFTSKFATYFS
jgi:hypothetical protein